MPPQTPHATLYFSRVTPNISSNLTLLYTEGMSMDAKTTRQDTTVQLHLDAVTVQDRARPKDSPFRNMIYSTPDETTHGGLIHVTYWGSAGGRRVPPVSIAHTNQQEYDMVFDAHFSTVQVFLRVELQ